MNLPQPPSVAEETTISSKVFDRSVNARAKLLNYVRIVNSLDDLRDIEKAMNGPRG